VGRFLWPVAGVLLLSSTGSPAQEPSHDEAAGPPALKAQDVEKDLKNTRVTAHLQQKHEAGKNLLWCATFQAAWDELSGVLKGPVRLGDEPEMAAGLNARLASRGDLAPDSFVTRAGFVRDGVIDAIQADLKRLFEGKASPALLPAAGSLKPEDIVAYAYLFKSMAYETPLARDSNPLHFGGAAIQGFGIWKTDSADLWNRRARQVSVLRYRDADDFIVSLSTKDPKDLLLVARMKPGATLLETVETAVKRADAGSPSAFRAHDAFKAPVLNFDLTRIYGEIIGKTLRNEGFAGYFIADARQNIRFRFDESGALLKSEALLVPKDGGSERHLICSGPFLVLMRRAGAKMPYFALWVEDPELMVPAPKPGR